MHPAVRRSSIALIVAPALALAGCGGGSKAAPAGATTTTTAVTSSQAPSADASSSTSAAGAGATTSTTGARTPATGKPGASASTAVSVPGAGVYTLAATANKGAGPCKEPVPGGKDVPFTVSITNTTGDTVPLARIAVAITDPKASTTNGPVAAISYKGICLNFTEPGDTMTGHQTVTYDGTASGVSAAATLNVTLISTPDNSTLGQVSTSLG